MQPLKGAVTPTMPKIKRIVPHPLPWYRNSDFCGFVFVAATITLLLCELTAHLVTGNKGPSKILSILDEYLYS